MEVTDDDAVDFKQNYNDILENNTSRDNTFLVDIEKPCSSKINTKLGENKKQYSKYSISSDEEDMPITQTTQASDDDREILSAILCKYVKSDESSNSKRSITKSLTKRMKLDQKEDNDDILSTFVQKENDENKLSTNKENEKKQLKLQKQKENDTEKEIKKALILQDKNLKPDQCIKFITAKIDSHFQSEPYFEAMTTAITHLGSLQKTVSNPIPFSITWSRLNQSHFLNEDGKICLTSTTEEINELLLILNWKDVIQHVKADSLVTYVHSIKTNSKLRVSLGIYGLENYFRYWKNKTKFDYTQSDKQKKKNKFDKIFKDVPCITKKDLEMTLTEIQVLFSCSSKYLESPADVGLMVSTFTKAIAQAPYKIEKRKQYKEMDRYIMGDNKDCVRVDKYGNGLQRLWKQQLTMFPLSSLEMAEAIMSHYPTLSSIMEAYEKSENPEQMLQDIPIRRAAGHLSTVRKLGPEFSKKLYNFFTSLDNSVIL